jgi:hypothetical protein
MVLSLPDHTPFFVGEEESKCLSLDYPRRNTFQGGKVEAVAAL